MSAFFTNHFRAALFANGNLMENANVRLCFFRSAPSLDTIDPAWLAARTKAELLATTGWSEVNGIGGYPLTNTLTVATRSIPLASDPTRDNRYVIFSQYPFSQLTEPAPVEAIGVEYIGTVNTVVNPLIMVSTTPVGEGTSLFPADALTANPDVGNLGPASNRYIFAWEEPPAGATVVNPIEGPLSIFKGAPDFEASNTIHVWLYPSRANMIANPSFEAVGTGYWACNGTITRTAAPAPGGGGFCGQFVGGPTVIIESNVWSTRLGNIGSEYWTIQLMASGVGRVKVGLISWDADYRSTACDWGDGETWEMVPNAWVHIATVRRAPDADTAMLRIEGADYGTLFIDRVLAERGALKDWPYFDGDSTFALQDSYTWYGGYARRGASYSMWYDMRRSVMGRLFATPVDTTYPGDVLSDAEVAEAGMVYQWVPAGVSVIPHIDVFYPGDTRPPPPAKSAAIQPYYHPDTQRMGVVNPWV